MDMSQVYSISSSKQLKVLMPLDKLKDVNPNKTLIIHGVFLSK